MNISPALRFLASQTWAVEGRVFEDLVSLLDRHANGERLSAEAIAAVMTRDPKASDAREPAMSIQGDTAVIPVRGLLARYSDGVNGMCQERGRSAESVQSDLLAAAAQGVNKIVMVIDSPGGEVSGTAETARLVSQLSDSGIEMIAYLDGTCCSAAYWIASACKQVIASAPTVRVGSIGCAMTFTERTADDKREKTHVIKSAAAKGVGPVNNAMLANLQSLCNDMAKAFADGVQQGRGLTDEQTAAVATGEVWTAQTAQALGLIDAIADLSTVTGRTQITAGGTSPLGFTAAAQPAGTPEDSMKLTAQVLAALVASAPAHAKLISDRAIAGDDETAIRAAIGAADITAANATIADLRGQMTAQTTSHQTALAALQTRLDAAEARATAAEASAARARNHAAPADVGNDNPPTSGALAALGENAKACTGAQYDAMSVAEREAFAKRGGVVV